YSLVDTTPRAGNLPPIDEWTPFLARASRDERPHRRPHDHPRGPTGPDDRTLSPVGRPARTELSGPPDPDSPSSTQGHVRSRRLAPRAHDDPPGPLRRSPVNHDPADRFAPGA